MKLTRFYYYKSIPWCFFFYLKKNSFIQATQEEIVNAYRQQSKIYHPDKHVDPALKKEAEILFNRTRQAFQGSL